MSSYQLQDTPDWNDPTIEIIATPGYYYVYGVALPMLQINLICSAYIVFRVLNRLYQRGSCPAHIRFPMYTAITDILLYIGNMNNLLYGVLWGHTRPANIGCQFAASFVSFAVFMNMSITCSYVLNIYLNVCKEIYIDTGVWEWKLISACSAFAITMAGIGFPFTGPCYYWCYLKADGGKLFAWIFTAVEGTLFAITAICFYLIYTKVDSISATSQATFVRRSVLKRETFSVSGLESVRILSGICLIIDPRGFTDSKTEKRSSYYMDSKSLKDAPNTKKQDDSPNSGETICYLSIAIILWYGVNQVNEYGKA
ncbi:hypothetical protein HDV06_001765 [Boothiomyces sp. JEL0866]|nr:hypothetical protein HDV06_001765 [Boothiomyces sp. JEL0866]